MSAPWSPRTSRRDARAAARRPLDTQRRARDAPNKVEVGEDERLVELEAARNDVLGVLVRKAVALLELEVRLEQELLVVCEREDGRA